MCVETWKHHVGENLHNHHSTVSRKTASSFWRKLYIRLTFLNSLSLKKRKKVWCTLQHQWLLLKFNKSFYEVQHDCGGCSKWRVQWLQKVSLQRFTEELAWVQHAATERGEYAAAWWNPYTSHYVSVQCDAPSKVFFSRQSEKLNLNVSWFNPTPIGFYSVRYKAVGSPSWSEVGVKHLMYKNIHSLNDKNKKANVFITSVTVTTTSINCTVWGFLLIICLLFLILSLALTVTPAILSCLSFNMYIIWRRVS